MTAFRKPWVSLLAVLLLGAPLLARASQDRSPANDSSVHEVEPPRAEPPEPAPAPSPEPPSEPPSAPQAEPSAPQEVPSAPQEEPSAPADPSSEDSSGRTAVPLEPDAVGHGPSRQPPTRHGHGGGGSQDDDGGVLVVEPEPDWSTQAPSVAPAVPARHRAFRRGAHNGMGALDLDIQPRRARVSLNGQAIGVADSFDGWPRYLWLPPGTYDLAFSLDGFRTLARRVKVVPGLVIDMDDHLQPGPP